MKMSRLVVGLILVGAAMLLLVWGEGDSASSGATALGVLGLIAITLSRRM